MASIGMRAEASARAGLVDPGAGRRSDAIRAARSATGSGGGAGCTTGASGTVGAVSGSGVATPASAARAPRPVLAEGSVLCCCGTGRVGAGALAGCALVVGLPKSSTAPSRRSCSRLRALCWAHAAFCASVIGAVGSGGGSTTASALLARADRPVLTAGGFFALLDGAPCVLAARGPHAASMMVTPSPAVRRDMRRSARSMLLCRHFVPDGVILNSGLMRAGRAAPDSCPRAQLGESGRGGAARAWRCHRASAGRRRASPEGRGRWSR